eukprot:TRINITY_DN79991_c0_g1_i1.p1 TRINITY_DN79991_c0_g1~~TRINITY_DN79991_c0_g1_i1.p1  ORF type:complete len:388 (-),score=71.83 TRINITY_DN79991_c0_g1_i1:218-1381(-)
MMKNIQRSALFCLFIFTLTSCGNALSVARPEKHQRSKASDHGSGFLDASASGVVVQGAASYPEQETIAAREARTETLAEAEQAALLSQQQAMEQIAREQVKMAQEQTQMKSEAARMEDALHAYGESQSKESSEAEARMLLAAAKQATSMAAHRVFKASMEPIVLLKTKNWKTELLGAIVWFIGMLLAGLVYGVYFTYPYKPPRIEPRPGREGFSFSLFHAFLGDPDFRICCFSCFCTPVRWADTASSPKLGAFRLLTFWPGLALFGSLYAFNTLTFSLTGILLIALAVYNRHHIRRAYGMPHYSAMTCLEDTFVWCFCHSCATMQEAMEVEFMDPPASVSHPEQESMLKTNMDTIKTDPEKKSNGSKGGAKTTEEAGTERKKNFGCC